ncbi:MAG: response regulator [Anaerolineales bacterium]|nr:MAG: response regulator [Anaerolineales bacterium]
MKTAWYVDDDQEMIQAVTLMMSLLDFEVRPFLHPRAAAKAFVNGRPDLLILDINMPGVSGIEMLEFIRLRTEYIDLPIIMLSSEYTDAQVDEALAKGADAFVMKPVTLDELEIAIQKAFQIRGVS